MEKPGLQGFDLVRIKCKKLTWEVKENRSPSRLRVFILEVGGGVSMLRWGGSNPAPPAPQCMPNPNKLRSHSAALPPETLCFLLRPRQGRSGSTQGPLVPSLWAVPQGRLGEGRSSWATPWG